MAGDPRPVRGLAGSPPVGVQPKAGLNASRPPKERATWRGSNTPLGQNERQGHRPWPFCLKLSFFWLLCKLAEVGQKLAPARSHGMAFGAMAGDSGSLPAAIASTPGPSPTVSSAVACLARSSPRGPLARRAIRAGQVLERIRARGHRGAQRRDAGPGSSATIGAVQPPRLGRALRITC